MSAAAGRALDVGVVHCSTQNMQYYSFVPSDSNRETEPNRSHVGVWTPEEQ